MPLLHALLGHGVTLPHPVLCNFAVPSSEKGVPPGSPEACLTLGSAMTGAGQWDVRQGAGRGLTLSPQEEHTQASWLVPGRGRDTHGTKLNHPG